MGGKKHSLIEFSNSTILIPKSVGALPRSGGVARHPLKNSKQQQQHLGMLL